MRFTLLIVVLTLCIGCTCLAQKITVDPNAGNTLRAVEMDTSDSRLAQKITYEAWHTPLKSILADLSKSTGVTLNAGFGKMDWQVRDRRMNVYVKDVTLAQLMNSIARVMKFKWSRGEDKKLPTYRLVADRRLLAKLQAKAAQLADDLKKEETGRRKALVDGLAKAAKASGADLEALKKDNPYLGLSATTGFAQMMTQMFAEQPMLKDMFVRGDKMAILKANEFSTSTRKLIADVLRYGATSFADRKSVPDNLDDDIALHTINFQCIAPPFEHDQRQQLTYYGYLGANISDGSHFISDLKDPEAPSSKISGAYRLSIAQVPRESQTDWGKFQTEENSGIKEDAKQIEPYLMLDPVAEHPDDPDLAKDIILDVTKEDEESIQNAARSLSGRARPRLIYQLLLKATAKAAKMNVISDSYSVVLCDSGNFADAKLKAILDRIADDYRCNWEKHGTIIEFRRRDWFRRRASQVPDVWVKPWHDQVENDGTPTLSTYTNMLSLTDEQIEENVLSDVLLDQAAGQWWEYSFNKGFCRFYSQLSNAQRAQILSDVGLDSDGFSSVEWSYCTAMFADGWHPATSTSGLADQKSSHLELRGSVQQEKDNSTTYRFVASRGLEDGKTIEDTWKIPLRKVVRPQDTGKTK